jgi:hypothetical protein
MRDAISVHRVPPTTRLGSQFAVAVRAVEERRRREHGVAVVDQLRREAVLVVVFVGRRHRGVRRAGGRGGIRRRGADGADGQRARLMRPHRAAPAAVVGGVDCGAAAAAVLVRVGVAAGELLHQRAEARLAGRHPHGVADVHHLDRRLLPAASASSLPLALARRAAAGRAPLVGIALGSVPLPGNPIHGRPTYGSENRADQGG